MQGVVGTFIDAIPTNDIKLKNVIIISIEIVMPKVMPLFSGILMPFY